MRGEGGGVVTFFVLKVPNYKSPISIYLRIRTHDTGRSFEPIFMKFTWLALVHPWVNTVVLKTVGPIEPQI